MFTPRTAGSRPPRTANPGFAARTIEVGQTISRTPAARIVVSVVAAATAIFGVITGFQTASAAIQSSWDRYTYVHSTLARPFVDEIPGDKVDKMTSGEAQVAIMQIEGYLGRLKDAPNWQRRCIASSLSGNKNSSTEKFLNTRFVLEPSVVDSKNLQKLTERVDYHDLKKDEDAEIVHITDYFQRLSKRASRQLLVNYPGEIAHLTTAQLYLLRNSIYGRIGYHFQTEKLIKLGNRRGWNNVELKTPTAVEVCNAFYLAELHSASELGAAGRAVLVNQALDVPREVKAELCSCLSRHEIGIECGTDASADFAAQFSSYVDFVLDVQKGEAARLSWTFLDPKRIGQADRDDFESHADAFTASAIDLSADVQGYLTGKKIATSMSINDKRGAYFGVSMTLPPALLDQVPSDPTLTRDAVGAICKATDKMLEAVAPFIPSIQMPDVTVQTDAGPLTFRHRSVLLGDERKQTLRAFVEAAYASASTGTDLAARAIVLHGASRPVGDELSDMQKAFNPTPAADLQATADIGFATHYIVETDGSVDKVVDDGLVARHEAGLDLSSIGILVMDAGAPVIRQPQVEATVKLVTFLEKKYTSIKYVVDANDTNDVRKTEIWLDPALPFTHSLPGAGAPFTAAVQAKLKSHGLASR